MKLKSLLLLSLGIAIYSTSNAQSTENKKRSMIFDFSETWCGPCGQYGIDVADSLIAKIEAEDVGYLISPKSSSTPTSMNGKGTAALFSYFKGEGVPTFFINDAKTSDGVTGNNKNDVTRLLGKVRTGSEKENIVNIDASVYNDGSVITVDVNTTFVKDVTGEYSIAVIVTEDEITAKQTGYSKGDAIHRYVMRGTMAKTAAALTTNPIGYVFDKTSIAKDDKFSETFKTNIQSTWVAKHIVLYAVVFKKESDGTYSVQNALRLNSEATSIDNNLLGVVSSHIYPNPASENVTIGLQSTSSNNLNISVVDILGKVVIPAQVWNVTAGNNVIDINTNDLPNGIYNVLINGDKGAINHRLIINK